MKAVNLYFVASLVCLACAACFGSWAFGIVGVIFGMIAALCFFGEVIVEDDDMMNW